TNVSLPRRSLQPDEGAWGGGGIVRCTRRGRISARCSASCSGAGDGRGVALAGRLLRGVLAVRDGDAVPRLRAVGELASTGDVCPHSLSLAIVVEGLSCVEQGASRITWLAL